ncbi:MAG TPA: trehalose-phosphatase [Mycobacterium sp.]|nr:trehalose-phosphatase [Mycobacterium sp.]
MPPTIDPRLQDAVIFAVPQSDSADQLARRLHDAGIATANADAGTLAEVSRRLGARAERSAVIAGDADAVIAGRDGGFSMVIGIGTADDLAEHGADAVVDNVGAIQVRTGDSRMSEIPNAVASFGQIADALSGRPAVCLDYDGTLSAIVPDPDSAELVDGAADALARLAERCPVAILSGRDLADIRYRVGVPGLWYAGSHGFESVAPDGSYRQNEDAAAAVPVLEEAAAQLRKTLESIGGIRVEHKRFAVAIHYRDVAVDQVGTVVAATYRVGHREHLRVTNGRKVVELRPDVDWNKGSTLDWICEQIEQEQPVLPIYLGDDLTDEDAFDAIRADGIGILVRHTEDGDRPSAARFTLDSPDQVLEFLDRLAHTLS